MNIAVSLFAILLVATSYGIYLAFGPPNKELEDPFDHHDD